MGILQPPISTHAARADNPHGVTAAQVPYTPAGTGAVARTVQDKGRDTVSPEDFGAVGDGVTDDRAALINALQFAALQSGRIVDGNGRLYAVSGTVNPAIFSGLCNIRLRQLAPATLRTLVIDGASDFVLRGVRLDCNGQSGDGNLSNSHGIYINNCGGFFLSDVRVRNGGAITGIGINGCTTWAATKLMAREFSASFASEPTDDEIQGVAITNCQRWMVSDSHVRSFNLSWPGRPAVYRRWGRGFVVSASSDGRIVNCHASEVDQGFDLTGSALNRDITLVGCHATDCTTVGFKTANSYQGISWIGLTAARCGLYGFQWGGPTEAGQTPRDCIADGCLAIDTGSNGLWGSAPNGFRLVRSNTPNDLTYPRNVRIRSSLAVDRQAVPTMAIGFSTDVNIEAASTNDVNVVENCESIGHTNSAVSGFGGHVARMAGSEMQSVPDSTWTFVSLAVANINNSRLGDGVNECQPRAAGVYHVVGQIVFAANATGYRGARLRVNGNTDGEAQVTAVSGAETILRVDTFMRLNRGNTIRLQAFQNSGGALNIDGTRSWLAVNRVQSWG